MFVKINRMQFLQTLSSAQAFVDRRSTAMPVLQMVHCYTQNDSLVIEATDLELSYRTHIACAVGQPGDVLFEPKRVSELLKVLLFEEISLRVNEQFWVCIQGVADDSAGMEYEIAGLSSDDFPVLPEAPIERSLPLSSALLKEMIDKTIFSVAVDSANMRTCLKGISVELAEGADGVRKLRMVSSDGTRLTLIDRQLSAPFEWRNIVLPKKGAMELRKLLDRHSDVRIVVERNFLFALDGSESIGIRLIDDKFPSYQRIIPQETAAPVEFDRNKLLSLLRRIVILADDLYYGVRAVFGDGYVDFELIQQETAKAKERLPMSGSYSGTLVFNGRFMLDILSSMQSSVVSLAIQGEKHPCVITGAQDEGFLALFMPIVL